jgi:hypothetical protein
MDTRKNRTGPVEHRHFVKGSPMLHRARSLLAPAVLLALVASLLGAVQPAAAAEDTQDIRISTINSEDDSYNVDPCYVLVDFSNEGCDRNDDGSVTFDDVPFGTYTVHQTADMGDHRVPDFVIDVDGSTSEFVTYTEPKDDQAGTEDITVETVYSEGSPAVDVCYVLVGYSNEGCDENQDGVVTFGDIPHGTYILRQTKAEDNTGAPLAPDMEITVGEDSTHFIVEIDWVPA